MEFTKMSESVLFKKLAVPEGKIDEVIFDTEKGSREQEISVQPKTDNDFSSVMLFFKT